MFIISCRLIAFSFLLMTGILGAVQPAKIFAQEPIFWEDFEQPDPEWQIENGVWEIGVPTAGPGSAHEGSAVAGTVLGGNYPYNTDSRLISPAIDLSTVSGDERLELRYWQWFAYNYSGDLGRLQISVWNGSGWDNWVDLSNPAATYSSNWAPVHRDLTAYAGQTVRLCFYHNSDCCGGVNLGWYIDEVEIWQGVPVFNNPEGFENGWGDWYTDQGVWEIGVPTAGPGRAGPLLAW